MSTEVDQLSSTFINDLREKFLESLYFACIAVLEAPFGGSFISEKVHKPLCNIVSDYKKNLRLALVYPRGWLKSQIISVYYPVWRAMGDPNFTSLCALNTYTNATKKLLAKRVLINNNPLLARLFPERMPDSSCQQSVEAFSLPRSTPLSNATFEAAGVGTDTTSRHFDLLVEDDTVAPEFDHMTGSIFEPSQEQCEKAIGFHRSSFFLQTDFAESQRIVVGTRWRQDDLFTYIKKEEPNFRFIERAAKENESGEPDEDGQVVYPERFPQIVLDETKKSVGPYMYSALMMNSPLKSENMVFDKEKLKYYSEEPLGLLTFTTVDPAPSDSKSANPDYNVVLTCGLDMRTGRIYVLDYFRKRCNPGELIEAIFLHYERFKALTVGIETVAYQKTIMYWLRERMLKRKLWFNIEELKTSRMSKPARIRGLQPIIENGRLFIRASMDELVQELIAFPLAAHDDIIDALAYQLSLWRSSETAYEEEAPTGLSRFSGGALLDELNARLKRPKGFPFDSMGQTQSGHDFAAYEPAAFYAGAF